MQLENLRNPEAVWYGWNVLGFGGAQPDLTSQLIVILSQLLIIGEQQRVEMSAWEGGRGQMWTAVCGLWALGCGVQSVSPELTLGNSGHCLEKMVHRCI